MTAIPGLDTDAQRQALRSRYGDQSGRMADDAEDWLQIICGVGSRHALTYWREATAQRLFVYFIQAGDRIDGRGFVGDGPVKIGQATNPLGRLSELQCGNPRDLVLQEVVLASPNLERKIHKHWESARVRGEWFGKGLEQAILQVAAIVSRRQIEDHQSGKPAHEVVHDAEHGPLIYPSDGRRQRP